MGLFTEVKVHEVLMPEKYKHLSGFQTKDVIDFPTMETLEVNQDGELIYVWQEREWFEDKEYNIIGGYFKSIKEHRDKLEFHGDMIFYTIDMKTDKMIELIARFSYGKLDYIKEYKND